MLNGATDPDLDKMTKESKFRLNNNQVLTLTATTTIGFNKDGSATLTTTITGSVTTVDPNTGKSSTEALAGGGALMTETQEVDRNNDGQITVNGKVAPRSWGDNIKAVANIIATAVDPVGSLIHNGGETTAHLADFMQSKEGAAILYQIGDLDRLAAQGQGEILSTMGSKIWNWFSNGVINIMKNDTTSESDRRHNSCADGVASRFCSQ